MPRILFALVVALAAGCASSAPKPGTELLDRQAWTDMLAEGLAVAPVAGVQVVTGSAETAAAFADELQVSLVSALPGTRVVSSDEVYARLESVGADAHARIRSLRRRLVRDEDLDAAEMAAIGRDVAERFLLMVFMDESSVEGFKRTEADDFRAFSYSMDTHRYPTGELHGRALAALVDTREASRVWTAEIHYQSENLAAAEERSEKIIRQVRADAAVRLAESLALADRAD